jgi:ribosomal-protein-alanine N-acetyltransferase
MPELMDGVIIERMREEDLDAISAIERDVFSDPWPRSAFESEVADARISLPMVVLERGAVLGYLVAWLVADEVHLGNIAVARPAQRRGIGQRMLDFLAEVGRDRRARFITLEVRETNAPAQRLYARNEYRPVAVRKKYYRDTLEDAIVMVKEL